VKFCKAPAVAGGIRRAIDGRRLVACHTNLYFAHTSHEMFGGSNVVNRSAPRNDRQSACAPRGMKCGDGQMEFVRIAGTSELIPGQIEARPGRRPGHPVGQCRRPLLRNRQSMARTSEARCARARSPPRFVGVPQAWGTVRRQNWRGPLGWQRFSSLKGRSGNTVRFEVLVDGAQVFVGVSALIKRKTTQGRSFQ